MPDRAISTPVQRTGRAVQAVEPGQNLLFSFPFDGTTVSREDADLVITFDSGGELALEGFFVANDAGKLPDMKLADGTRVDAADFLRALNPDLDVSTAAGPVARPMGSGEGEYSDDGGDLLGGVDRLGILEGIGFAKTFTPSEDIEAASALDAGPGEPGGSVTSGEIVFSARAVLYRTGDADDTLTYAIHFRLLGADGKPVADPAAAGYTLTSMNKLVDVKTVTFDENGLGTIMVSESGKTLLGGADAPENLYDYLTITVGGKTYTMQVVLNRTGNYDTADEHDAWQPDGSLTHEWHTETNGTGEGTRFVGDSVDEVFFTNKSGAAFTNSTLDTGTGADTVYITGATKGVFTEGDGPFTTTITAVEGVVAIRGGSSAAAAESTDKIYGIHTKGDGTTTITASEVDLKATSNGTGHAFGVLADGAGASNTITGSDSITINATSNDTGEAYGLLAEGFGASNAISGGDSITINAITNGTGRTSPSDEGHAYGVRADGIGASNTINGSASVTINAVNNGDAANATGVFAYQGGQNVIGDVDYSGDPEKAVGSLTVTAKVEEVGSDRAVALYAYADADGQKSENSIHAKSVTLEAFSYAPLKAGESNAEYSTCGMFATSKDGKAIGISDNTVMASDSVTLDVRSFSKSAIAMHAATASSSNTIIAGGKMTMDAAANAGMAFGMYTWQGVNTVRSYEAGRPLELEITTEGKAGSQAMSACGGGRNLIGVDNAGSPEGTVGPAILSSTVVKGGTGDAYGMVVSPAGGGANIITSSDSVSINTTHNGTGHAYGMHAKGAEASNSITGSGGIAINATSNGTGHAYGVFADIYAKSGGANFITSDDSVTINATNNGTGHAYGVYVNGAGASNTISGDGSAVTVKAVNNGDADNATGVFACQGGKNLLGDAEKALGSLTVTASVKEAGTDRAVALYAYADAKEAKSENSIHAESITLEAFNHAEGVGAAFAMHAVSSQAAESSVNSIYAEKEITVTAKNTGIGADMAYAVRADGKGASNSLVGENDSTITINASNSGAGTTEGVRGGSTVAGLYASALAENRVAGAGTVKITAMLEDGAAWARGLYASSSGKNTIEDVGLLTVTATAAKNGNTASDATAMHAHGKESVNSVHAGSITLEAFNYAQGDANCLYANGAGASNTVTASGAATITAYSAEQDAFAMHAASVDASNTITADGKTTIDVTAEEGTAYGMYTWQGVNTVQSDLQPLDLKITAQGEKESFAMCAGGGGKNIIQGQSTDESAGDSITIIGDVKATGDGSNCIFTGEGKDTVTIDGNLLGGLKDESGNYSSIIDLGAGDDWLTLSADSIASVKQFFFDGGDGDKDLLHLDFGGNVDARAWLDGFLNDNTVQNFERLLVDVSDNKSEDALALDDLLGLAQDNDMHLFVKINAGEGDTVSSGWQQGADTIMLGDTVYTAYTNESDTVYLHIINS